MLNLYALLLYVRTHIKLNNIAETLFKKPTQQINWKGQTKKPTLTLLIPREKRWDGRMDSGAHLHRDDAKQIWPIMGYIENKICIKLNLESILINSIHPLINSMKIKTIFIYISYIHRLLNVFFYSIFFILLFNIYFIPFLFFPKFPT